MAAADAYARSLARVERICSPVAAPGADDRSLRVALLDEVRRTLGFDAYSWLLTDPETAVGTSPLADVPCLPELNRLIRLRYLNALNRWTHLAPDTVATLRAATGGELARSVLWRELLGSYGVVDLATVVFVDQFGCWGFLDLWRTGDAGWFTPEEVAYLTGLTAVVTAALRRSQASSFVASATATPAGPAVLLLAPDLTVRVQTPETAAILRVLLPAAPDRPPVPSSAYNVAAQLLANEAGVDGHQPWARLHVADGRWVTLRAGRIGGDTTPEPTAERDIAVTIEASSPTERIGMFARASGLTPRETELLGLLVPGPDTRELGRLMFLSEHTVQDHLKAIFAKTSVRSRRALLSRALGG